MKYLTEKKFSFKSKAVDKGTFGVVFFSGEEGLSQLYQFDITLVSSDANIDMDKMLQENASFFIHRSDGSKVPFHGVLAEFDLLRTAGKFYLYRAILVPKLWRLTLTHHNQIFLNKKPKSIINAVLKDGGLTSNNYEFRLKGKYVTWDYVCQYGESHYDFVARWMEDNGLYYFFDQSGDSEKLIITDSSQAHIKSDLGASLVYSQTTGLESLHLDEVIQSYVSRRLTTPKKIILQDYNYRKPSLNILGKSNVDKNGFGEMYFYGDHFRTPEEGKNLAKIRSEELLCRSRQFHGESTVPYLMPGYTYGLENHFRDDMNRDYLTISIEHEGNQASYLISGIRENLTGIELKSVYHNSFTAIADDVQFRRERLTKRPKLHGTINAVIDGSGTDKYAEVDEYGRYKVALPFDRANRSGGKASAWIRMMQPYGGSDHGMNFPLHKGCEVLLIFIDGNPDRPVIAGAVANPENPSQITTDSQTMSKLTTSGGNKIHIEDKEGQQRILHQAPTAATWMRMGAPNDPPAAGDDESAWDKLAALGNSDQKEAKTNEDGFAFSTEGSANWIVGVDYKVEVGGISNSLVVGGENKIVLGEETRSVVGFDSCILIGGVNEVHVPEKWTIKTEHWESGIEKVKTWASETKASVEKAVVDGVNNKVAEIENKVAEAKTSISEQWSKLCENVSSAYTSAQKVLGDLSEAIGEKLSSIGAKTEAVGEKTEAIGEKTSAVGEKTEAIGEKTVAIGEKTEAVGAKTDAVGEKTTVAGVVEIL